MKNLKFRIYSVSSQNNQFPAKNIQENSGIWQSQHNCQYPQQMTLQFFVPIQTRNMKITFHQYKIPKLIQVFVKLVKQEKYRKLGIVQPNDNTQSDFHHKEIKTVFFQFPCSFVKLVFHQNYRNEMNLFDQIAISELLFEGQVLPTSQFKNLNINILDSLDTESQESDLQEKAKSKLSENVSLPLSMEKKPSQKFNSILFPQVFEKFEQAKNLAVQKEQFQKAQYIKNSIMNFQQMQKQILKLEQIKKIALAEEDYDQCHKLKNQIIKKKQSMAYQIKQFQDHVSDINTLTFSRANNRQNLSTHRQSRIQPEQKLHKTPVMNRNVSPNNGFEDHESQVVPALRKKKNIEEQYMTVSKKNESVLDHYGNPTTQKRQQFDQAQQSIDEKSYNISKLHIDFPKLQQLQFRSFKRYEPFFSYISLDLWRMILSVEYQKNWKLKAMALDEISCLEVRDGKQLIALMQFVSITVCDNHTINIKKSLQLLEKLINLRNKDFWCDPNYSKHFIDKILSTLIHLMSDTKQQFRKLSIQIYKNLPQFSLVQLERAVKNLIKVSQNPSTYNKNKRKSNPKVQLAKLSILDYYFNTFTDFIYHLNDIVRWVAECAQDPNRDVKNSAYQMLLQISRVDKEYYTKIKEQLSKLGSDTLSGFQSMYNALMDEIQSSKMMENVENQQSIDIHHKETMKRKNKNTSRVISENSVNLGSAFQKQANEIELAYSQQSLENIRENESHDWFTSNNSQLVNQNNSKFSKNQQIYYNNSSSHERQVNQSKKYQNNHSNNQIKVMQLDDDQLEGMCDYCYQKYENIDMNEHLLKYCPAVIPCHFCKCVVYIRQFTEHLLTSCEVKKHQQCPRCLLAFQFDEINEHIARKICRKSKGNMQRCPFCEQDIEAEDIEWAQHSVKCEKLIKSMGRLDINTQNSLQYETEG